MQTRLSMLLVLLGLALVLGPPAAAARAQGDGIEVVKTAAESRLPDGIRFSIAARSPHDIDDIRIVFRRVDVPQSTTYRKVDFAPGKEVSGEVLLRIGGGSGYIPPGTRLAYSFEVRDKSGRVHITPEQEFLHRDNRFDWSTVGSGLITVYYYGANGEKRARAVLEAAEEALRRMGPVLGVQPTVPLRIYSYAEYSHLASAIPFRSQVVSQRLETHGTAFSEERVVLVYGFHPLARGTVSHELTHLLVAEAAGRRVTLVPAWLNEGLAEYGNLQPSDDFPAALRYGISTARLKPLWFQRTFVGTPDDIMIAYGQGQSVVQHLISRYGEAKMAQLLRHLRDGTDIDQALERVYGLDQRRLDTEWRATLGLAPLPTPGVQERSLPEQEPTPAGETAGPTPAVQPPGPAPTRAAEPAGSPVPTPAAAGEAEARTKASPGCGASRQRGTPLDLAGLALLVGLLAALARPYRWRRSP